jgi:hypothetical protein
VGANEPHGITFRIEDRATAGIDPFERAVLAADAVVDLVGFALLAQVRVKRGEHAFAVVGVNASLPGLAVGG